MFLLASGVPVVLLAVYMITVSAAASLIVLSIRIEDDLHIHETRSLARTYARSHLRLTGPQLEDVSTQEPRDRNLSLKWFTKPVAIILYVASIGQLGLFVLCFVFYNYRIF
jgi:type II secretory pathway component PulK